MKELSNLKKSTEIETVNVDEKGKLKNLLIIVLLLIIFISTTEKNILINNKNNQIQQLTQQVEQLKQENELLVETANQVSMAFDEQLNVVVDCVSSINELDEQNKKLVEEKEEVYSKLANTQVELNTVTDRLQTYEKYKYAVFYDGVRTDITYEQLKTGEQMMLANGLDPNWLFGIIMTESSGKSNAKNSCSTATGYGQMLKGTGKFVYESLLGNGKGTYNHSYALDGDLNIQMTAAYLNYLVDNSKKSSNPMYAATKGYRGMGGSVLNSYINKIDSFVSKSGTSFAKMSNDLK